METTTRRRDTARLRQRCQVLALWTAPWCFVLANTAYAWSTRHGGDDDTAVGALTLSAANPDLDLWATAVAMLGCLLLIPAVSGAMSVVRRGADRLGLVAGVLLVAGYVCYFALLFQGLSTIALARHGGASAANVAVQELMSEQALAPAVALTFVLGNIVGTTLLGVALWRAQAVPRWAALAVLAWPVLHILGGTWSEIVGSVAQAVGLAVVGRRLLGAAPEAPNADHHPAAALATQRPAASRGGVVLPNLTARTAPGRRLWHGVGRGVPALAMIAVLGACGGGTPSSTSPGATGATDRAAATAPTGTYASTSFIVPFDVTPPVWLGVMPHIEQPHFVTWEEPDLPAIRVLAPVTVYRPGEAADSAPPRDYLRYLLGQTSHGARFTHQVSTTISGQPAVLVTATTSTALDGSLGCPTAHTPAPDCFGLQPQLALRIAVIHIHDTTLLIWLRTPTKATDPATSARVTAFETMLRGLHFSSRTPAATPSPTSTAATGTPVDGDYAMTISWPKEKSTHPAAKCVEGAEGTSPQAVYELSLTNGSVHLAVRVGGPTAAPEPAFSGTYRVTGNQFVFGDGANPLTADYTLTGRALTLSHLRGGQCGDVAIWTTKPWTRR